MHSNKTFLLLFFKNNASVLYYNPMISLIIIRNRH